MLRPGSLAWLLCPLMCFHSGAAFAQKSPPPSEKISAAEVLKRHTAAMGGEDALRNLQTLQVQGDLAWRPSTSRTFGDMHFYYKAPNRDVFRLDSAAHGITAIGHSDGKPFEESTKPAERVEWLSGVAIGAMEMSCLAMIEWAYEQNYTHIELVAVTPIDGQWTYGLRFTSKYGDQQLRFYDASSFRLVRMVMQQRIGLEGKPADSAYSVETTFSDYDTSSGIPFPGRFTMKDVHGILYMEIKKVRRDEHLEDSLFTKTF